MIFHYFKDIYINYKSGFIKKKDVAEFKKFKTYSLLIGPEKIISQQIFKDFPGGEPSDEVNVLHEWIDELAKA